MLIVDLRRVDPVRPDPPGEYALQLTGALVRIAVHTEITVLEPGYKGPLPAGDTLLQPAGGRPSPGYRCIVAVHDLAHLHSGLLGFGRRFGTAFATSRSDLVLAPSEALAEGLRRFLRLPPERVKVVLPGLDADFARTSAVEAATVRGTLGLPERYLLAYGDGDLALRAWAGATTPAEGAGLVLADALPYRRQQLPALISGAVGVLLCESLNGCPIRALQAMACGSPPVVPDDGAFPEVVRDGGLTVRAGNLGDWSEAISALYRSRPLRVQLSARGRELAAGLTAERTARKVLELFEA
ncbi:MAG: glycosyltransferase [Candidatus Dormibacteraeota bacterium]|nr:glycosyltransferase [Candidatus Dormibacteraeota bacterium]